MAKGRYSGDHGGGSDHASGDGEHMIPRISIGAFCETAETAEAIERAAKDRRLARTHTKVEMGGVAAAVPHFDDAITPNLLFIETEGTSAHEIMSTLEPLASVCDPSTKVVVVGRSNDIGLYRELIRHGISEYLMAPLSSMQVIDAISQLYSSSGSALVGRLITCFGAKGGIGSSTVAHNLAWSLSQEHGISTILVDFDLAFGTAGLDFNQDPVQGVHDALLTPERLDAVLLDRLVTPIAERLSVFAAPATLESDYEFSPQSYETILDVVRASAPVVVVDMPRHWSAWVRQTLGSSSEIVLTAMPDLASLRNAKSVFDVVTASRPNDPMPRVVLNQVGVPKRPEIPTKDFTQALGVEPSLILPFDPQLFGTAANNGQMVAQLGAASRAAEGFRQLAGLVMGRTAVPEPASKTSGLAKIMGAFARKPTKKAG